MTHETAYTWLERITSEDLDDLAEREKNISLGSYVSSQRNYEADRAQIVGNINGLLTLFGIDKAEWPNRITNASKIREYGGKESIHPNDIKRYARDQDLGEFVTKRAWLAVPIEGDEYVTGGYSLTLRLGEEIDVEISSEGTHWVERDYIDPETRQIVKGDTEDLEAQARRGELDTDIHQVVTSISFSTIFSKSEVTEN